MGDRPFHRHRASPGHLAPRAEHLAAGPWFVVLAALAASSCSPGEAPQRSGEGTADEAGCAASECAVDSRATVETVPRPSRVAIAALHSRTRSAGPITISGVGVQRALLDGGEDGWRVYVLYRAARSGSADPHRVVITLDSSGTRVVGMEPELPDIASPVSPARLDAAPDAG